MHVGATRKSGTVSTNGVLEEDESAVQRLLELRRHWARNKLNQKNFMEGRPSDVKDGKKWDLDDMEEPGAGEEFRTAVRNGFFTAYDKMVRPMNDENLRTMNEIKFSILNEKSQSTDTMKLPNINTRFLSMNEDYRTEEKNHRTAREILRLVDEYLLTVDDRRASGRTEKELYEKEMKNIIKKLILATKGRVPRDTSEDNRRHSRTQEYVKMEEGTKALTPSGTDDNVLLYKTIYNEDEERDHTVRTIPDQVRSSGKRRESNWPERSKRLPRGGWSEARSLKGDVERSAWEDEVKMSHRDPRGATGTSDGGDKRWKDSGHERRKREVDSLMNRWKVEDHERKRSHEHNSRREDSHYQIRQQEDYIHSNRRWEDERHDRRKWEDGSHDDSKLEDGGRGDGLTLMRQGLHRSLLRSQASIQVSRKLR